MITQQQLEECLPGSVIRAKTFTTTRTEDGWVTVWIDGGENDAYWIERNLNAHDLKYAEFFLIEPPEILKVGDPIYPKNWENLPLGTVVRYAYSWNDYNELVIAVVESDNVRYLYNKNEASSATTMPFRELASTGWSVSYLPKEK